MIIRHSERESFDDADEFAAAQRYRSWTFRRFATDEKGGMKEVNALLREGGLEAHYKSVVHINAPMDDSKHSEADLLSAQCVKQHRNGVLLSVTITANAKRTEVVAGDEKSVEVRVTAKSVDGAANKELCAFIARLVGCGKHKVTLHSGHCSRHKCVLIQKVDANVIRGKLLTALRR